MDPISFVEQEAHPTEHSLRLNAGGRNTEVFSRLSQASTVSEIVASLASTSPKDFRPWPELAILYLQANNYKFLILVLSINDLLSSSSSSSFSSILSSDSSKFNSSTVWRAAPVLRRWMAPVRLKSTKCPVSCFIADHFPVLPLWVKRSCQEVKAAVDIRVCFSIKSSRITSFAM